MGATSIEWTERSVNPIRARGPNGKSGHHCVKVSPGCKRCYSSDFQPRFGLPVFREQAKDPPELYLDARTLQEVLRRRQPTTWFWCSMTDIFGDWVPDEWIAACFGVMAATPQHTHQVLTKRPERAAKWFEWIKSHAGPGIPWGGADFARSEGIESLRLGETEESRPTWNVRSFAEPVIRERIDIRRTREPDCPDAMPWPLPNVWLGTSVENQRYANRRIPALLECPAAIRFLSCEPLLGPLDLTRIVDWVDNYDNNELPDRVPEEPVRINALTGSSWDGEDMFRVEYKDHAPIDWVIVGGESGRGARPFSVDWGRDIRAQCKAAGVAFFFKQLGACANDAKNGLAGARVKVPSDVADLVTLRLKDLKGGDASEWPADLRVRELPEVRR